MKRICLAVGLFTVAFSVGVQAQLLDSQAKIPFDFWLGQKLMPAGGYSIYDLGGGAVLLRGENANRAGAMLLADRLSRPEPHQDAKWEFTRYGDVYFLSKIWTANQRDGYGIPKSAREKELASRSVPPKTTDIALSTK